MSIKELLNIFFIVLVLPAGAQIKANEKIEIKSPDNQIGVTVNRTFPHILNFEGVFGMEEVKWSFVEKDMPQYNVTFPFIRMLAGPVDFTPGAMRNAAKNDFYPVFNNPVSQGTRCHQLAMYVGYDAPAIKLEKIDSISSVPISLKLDPFYKKYLDADGIPVVASENVADEALIRTRHVITVMLSKRPDVKRIMVKNGCKVMIIGRDEEVCDLPGYAHICNTPENITYLNKRARGFGGAPEDAFGASFGEENILCLESDRYKGECILVHEFAHLIHLVGIAGVYPGFDSELEALLRNAIEKGRWKDTYAITNKEEYFAETVQSFFNCNRYSKSPNGVHNAINTRDKLKTYDPEMYDLLLHYFPESELDICDENYKQIQ
jgi:alpha-glucosidase